ncbi:MAG: hypothetical protein D6E12_01465 [Desulfovibrio sp.]|nr:MAG: hypothetical protein D6E12_01465 [Desulfovibrio sp.]
MCALERETFLRLANKRVNRVLKTIQEVGRLSNRANYKYTRQEVEQIIESMQREVDDCRKRFELAMNLDDWVHSAMKPTTSARP